MLNHIAAKLSDPGRKRPHNEDYADYFEPSDSEERRVSGSLFIVADGVGGAAKGERASRFAVQKVLHDFYQSPQVPPGERLRRIIRRAGNEIYHFAAESNAFLRMATTMVAAVLQENHLIVANVGDSRAYLIRNGQVQQLTSDHSYVGEMVREGLLSEAEAQHTKGKNKLTRSLGGEEDVQVDIFEYETRPGDRILLCSDGLTRYALAEDIARLASQGEPAEVVQRLVDFANQSGGADNVTTLLIQVTSAEAEPPRSLVTPGPRPAPVDLDTFVTEPLVSPRLSQPRTTIFSSREILMILVGVALMVAIVILSVALLVGPLTNPVPNPAVTLETPLVPTITLAPETATAVPATDTPTPDEVILVPPLGGMGQGEEITATATITLTAMITSTPQSTILPAPFCQYTTESGDNISVILEKFDILGTPYDQIECSPRDGICAYNPDQADDISDGWVLILPGVDPQICDQKGGKPLLE